MRRASAWARLLGLGAAVVEAVNFGDEGKWSWRSGRGGMSGIAAGCRRRSPGFDLGEGRRRWRALDLGMSLAFFEADAPRVRCREHGVATVADRIAQTVVRGYLEPGVEAIFHPDSYRYRPGQGRLGQWRPRAPSRSRFRQRQQGAACP